MYRIVYGMTSKTNVAVAGMLEIMFGHIFDKFQITWFSGTNRVILRAKCPVCTIINCKFPLQTLLSPLKPEHLNFLLPIKNFIWTTKSKKLILLTYVLGAFAKLWKAIINFVMSVCPSVVRVDQIGFYWSGFHEIWYLSTSRKSV